MIEDFHFHEKGGKRLKTTDYTRSSFSHARCVIIEYSPAYLFIYLFVNISLCLRYEFMTFFMLIDHQFITVRLFSFQLTRPPNQLVTMLKVKRGQSTSTINQVNEFDCIQFGQQLICIFSTHLKVTWVHSVNSIPSNSDKFHSSTAHLHIFNSFQGQMRSIKLDV